MFKIFEEPRPVMHIFDIRRQYSNMAYLIINYTMSEVNWTATGELYAVSDNSEESMDLYYTEMEKLRSQGISLYIGDTFNIDGNVDE